MSCGDLIRFTWDKVALWQTTSPYKIFQLKPQKRLINSQLRWKMCDLPNPIQWTFCHFCHTYLMNRSLYSLVSSIFVDVSKPFKLRYPNSSIDKFHKLQGFKFVLAEVRILFILKNGGFHVWIRYRTFVILEPCPFFCCRSQSRINRKEKLAFVLTLFFHLWRRPSLLFSRRYNCIFFYNFVISLSLFWDIQCVINSLPLLSKTANRPFCDISMG